MSICTSDSNIDIFVKVLRKESFVNLKIVIKIKSYYKAAMYADWNHYKRMAADLATIDYYNSYHEKRK